VGSGSFTGIVHMQIPLGEWDFNFQFPESTVDVQKQFALHYTPVVEVSDPNPEFEIEGTLTAS
jgi:hypothetical protein